MCWRRSGPILQIKGTLLMAKKGKILIIRAEDMTRVNVWNGPPGRVKTTRDAPGFVDVEIRCMVKFADAFTILDSFKTGTLHVVAEAP